MAKVEERDAEGEFTFPHLVKWVELAVRARVERAMKALPVSSSRLFALVLLEERTEATSADLARMMHITPQAMTTLLGPLRAEGYITRRSDDAHGRKQLLRLTEKGRAVLIDARELTPLIEEDLLAGFTREERHSLRTLLARIVRRLD